MWMVSFTGIKDLDFYTLNKLDDKELGIYCQTERRIRDICNNDEFWRRRIISKYGEHILKLKREGETYKQFYTMKDFNKIANAYNICKSIPHTSKLVLDDLYNPKTGYFSGFFRDNGRVEYFLLKTTYTRMLKDGYPEEELSKLRTVIDETVSKNREVLIDAEYDL